MRRQAIVALLLITASLGAMVADAQRPVNEEPTTLKESECYDCHSEGGGSLGPALPLLYLIHGPEELTIPIGEKATLEVGIENAWVSELQDIVAIADVSAAPFLGFSSDQDPITQALDGVIEAAPGINERTDRQTFTVVSGSTDLVVTAEPDSSSSTRAPADLVLRIWTPSQDPSNEAAEFTIDNGTADVPEVFEIHGAQQITELGVGEWTAEVAVKPPTNTDTSDPTGAVGVTEQPYLLTVFMDFRSTGEPRQFSGTSDVLLSRVEQPGAQAFVEWTIVAESMPSEPTTLPVEVILIAHYAHGSTQISQYDDWKFTKAIDLQVTPDPQNNAVIVRANSVAEVPDVKDAFAWDIFSEVLGYISAVLILASIYTGGMFGKASRRQLNTVFGTAKRRVAFHNFLSYAILAAAAAHTIVFLFEDAFDWTLGIIWGGIAILAMIALGVTGALQVPMIRKWNYATWRWSHFYLSIGTITFTIIHILLDGVHFTELQDSIGWSNPFTRT